MKTDNLLNTIDHEKIVEAIRRAERTTSGEVRVFISRGKPADPVAAARKEFVRMGMHKTAARNGVLILIAPRSRGLAIIGDAAVHERCGDTFWRKIADEMLAHCRDGKLTQAIVHGVEQVGGELAQHFPRSADDRNELSNKVEEG